MQKPTPYTLHITTKLKRVRLLRIISSFICSPVRLPLLLFYFLGRLADQIDNAVFDNYYFKFEGFVIHRFKWNDVAKEQYKTNPKKFK
ncbi:hypothetical protein CVD19_00310 [Bacillus sp. T33-2]|nr:hypothetical protein CVD19_00310 [Bacillus sp. T33-2]